MDAVKTYDYLVIARKKVLGWARGLTPEQYGRRFAIGPGSIARTLTHMLISEWYYVERLEGREVPPYAQWPIRDEEPLGFAVLEETWGAQAPRTRATLAGVRDWDAVLVYDNTSDEGKREIIRATRGDIATQLVLHEVHHRAQVMNMLRQLGVTLEDIDFNAFMYGRTPVAG
ncbi:MAG: DinB family protein [Planctomycetota bacterium]|nr:DinB family protein [Planctomycetota bacterium]